MDQLPGVVIGGVLVIAAQVLTQWLRGRSETSLDREKRADDRRLAHDQFQRETLLAVQDAVNGLSRRTALIHLHDATEYRRTGGDWGSTEAGTDAEEERRAGMALNTLRSRIADDDLREMVLALVAASTSVAMARDEATSDAALREMMGLATAILDRSGDLLRRTFTR